MFLFTFNFDYCSANGTCSANGNPSLLFMNKDVCNYCENLLLWYEDLMSQYHYQTILSTMILLHYNLLVIVIFLTSWSS